MSEVKSQPVTSQLVDSIIDAPAGSIKFYNAEGNSPSGFHFQCPCGCGAIGAVKVAGVGAWTYWNGSRDKPTVRESVALKTGEGPHWHGYLTDGVWTSC